MSAICLQIVFICLISFNTVTLYLILFEMLQGQKNCQGERII